MSAGLGGLTLKLHTKYYGRVGALSNGGLHRRTPPNRDTRAPEVCPVFILPRIPYPGYVTDIFARFTLFHVIHRHRYICSAGPSN